MNNIKRFLIIFLSLIIGSGSPLSVLAFTPNDPFYTEQLYLEEINAPAAWDLSLGSSNVTVAVIDSGIHLDHVDLEFWKNSDEIPEDGIDNDNNGFIDDYDGWDFVDSDNIPMPGTLDDSADLFIQHGTMVAGVIGASINNSEGIAGVSPNVSIMPIRIADDNGFTNSFLAAQAVEYAIDNGADVINMSLASVDSFFDTNLYRQIRRAYENDILVVAAAGNGDLETGEPIDLNTMPLYPICFQLENGEVLSVGVSSITSSDKLSNFSNYGSDCVSIAAPGEQIFSTAYYLPENAEFENERYIGYVSGTSFSAPMVTGAIAFMHSINNSLTAREQIDLLLQSSVNIDNQNSGFEDQVGQKLDVQKLIRLVIETKGTPVSNDQEGDSQDNVDENNNENDDSSQDVPSNSQEDSGFDEQGKSNGPGYNIVLGPYSNRYGEILLFNTNTGQPTGSFLSFPTSFEAGVSVASGDLNYDGNEEILVGALYGGGPHVKIFNTDGVLISDFFAYDSDSSGVIVTTADIDGDGGSEIITAPADGTSNIRIFNIKGELIRQFTGFENSFAGHISISSLDSNGDGKDEVLIGTGLGGEPIVRIYSQFGNLLEEFYAYESENRFGLSVAGGDLNGDGTDEVIASLGKGGSSLVKTFLSDGRSYTSFFVYEPWFEGGINLIVKQIDEDKEDEIIVLPRSQKEPTIEVYNGIGAFKYIYQAYESEHTGGLWGALDGIL